MATATTNDKKLLDKKMSQMINGVAERLDVMRRTVADLGGVAAINTALGAGTMDDFVAAYDAMKTTVNAHKGNFTPATDDLEA